MARLVMTAYLQLGLCFKTRRRQKYLTQNTRVS